MHPTKNAWEDDGVCDCSVFGKNVTLAKKVVRYDGHKKCARSQLTHAARSTQLHWKHVLVPCLNLYNNIF